MRPYSTPIDSTWEAPTATVGASLHDERSFTVHLEPVSYS